jgi:hypothetical protein
VKKRARPPYDPSVSEIIATPPANFTAMIDVPVTIGLVVRVDGMVRSIFFVVRKLQKTMDLTHRSLRARPRRACGPYDM